MTTSMKHGAQHILVRSAILIAIGWATLAATGCGMNSNADSRGNFKPGGETNKPDPDSVPDCYKGTGSGPGQFGGWRQQRRFVPDETPASATRAFDSLLRHQRTLGYGDGGGEGPGWGQPCP